MLVLLRLLVVSVLVVASGCGGQAANEAERPVAAAGAGELAPRRIGDGPRIDAPEGAGAAQAAMAALTASAVTGVFDPPRAFGNEAFASTLSADGRFVVMATGAPLVAADTNNLFDVYRFDRSTNEMVLVSVNTTGGGGNGVSFDPAVSADGTVVAFVSNATNLVSSVDANNTTDVFVRLLDASPVTRILSARNEDGTSGNRESGSPKLSADGSTVAFTSNAFDLMVRDNNLSEDVFVRGTAEGAPLQLVSVTREIGNVAGGGSLPAISANGQVVVFQSGSPNLVAGDTNNTQAVFARTTVAGEATTIKVSTSFSNEFVVSADGSTVAFASDGDVFVQRLDTGITTLVSVGISGDGGDGQSFSPSLSADGSVVAFASDASNLVANDANNGRDIFVRTLGDTATTTLESVGFPLCQQPWESSTA